MHVVLVIDVVDAVLILVPIKERFSAESLADDHKF